MNIIYDTYKHPRITVNIMDVEKDIKAGLSLRKIASKLKISDATLRRRIIENKGMDYYKHIIKSKEEKKKSKILKIEQESKEIRKYLADSNISDSEKNKLILDIKHLIPTSVLIIDASIINEKIDPDYAIKISKYLHRLIKKTGYDRSNNVVAGAAIYVHTIHKKREYSISQKEAEELFNISTVTIRNFFKFIKKTPNEIYKICS